MKRASNKRKAAAKPDKVARRATRSGKRAKPIGSIGLLAKVLSLIRTHPGIRPSELNRLLNRKESDGLRSTLIKRGLVRKKSDGSAMRYYIVRR
jgi:hypothetical protein